MIEKIVKTLTLTSIMATLYFTSASAETFEGTIQGADCVINDAYCAEDRTDPHLCMEKNFILVTEGKEYFFLPNLYRSLKESCYKQNVRVTGKRSGKAIRVDTLDVQKAGEYRRIWDRKKFEEDLYDR
ncbi:hypothetical protein [uncultured Desulfobacter sp.]|uniref:hypothetical protein n=1 Tax=uncultured Desulfobacter sp. TaxID=240139 RepID=UPI0029F5566E|nr:hypothetical protein [uncultured Desulfobacter sp.]